jgi:hypothetical protein
MAGLGQILGDQANTGWDWLHDANRDTLLVYKTSTRNAYPQCYGLFCIDSCVVVPYLNSGA